MSVISIKTITGRGSYAAAVCVFGVTLVTALVLGCATASADGLSAIGPRTHLQVAVWETGAPGEKAALQELFFSFQRANPDVIVALEWKDYDLRDDWTRRWFGGLRDYAPDITIMTEQRAWEHRHDLLEMPGDFGRELRRDYERSVMLRLPGQARGVPWDVSTYALYYRRDLLEQADLPVPETLEALVDGAEALADPPRRFGLGLPAPHAGGEELLHALAQAIGEPASDDDEAQEGPEETADERRDREDGEPDYTAALEMLVELQSRGAFQPEIMTWSDGELVELFIEGRLAMLIAPISAVRQLREAEHAPEWASTALPVAESGVGYLSVQWLVVLGNTSRPEAAVRLLRYVAEPESQRMLAMLPSVPAMREIADELSTRSPWQAHIAALQTATGVPLSRWERRRPQLAEALAYAISGRLTPEEALSGATEADR